MRKNETLEQESARKKAEAELPGRLGSMIAKVKRMKGDIIIQTLLKSKSKSYQHGVDDPNDGGEKSGMLSVL